MVRLETHPVKLFLQNGGGNCLLQPQLFGQYAPLHYLLTLTNGNNILQPILNSLVFHAFLVL
ncbi:MAG: hypothetical protein H5T99_06115 [Moorella sp. (in: Bacteria)]|nr:hypothetical protein [Moorella sp. (in: firmicutes)]